MKIPKQIKILGQEYQVTSLPKRKMKNAQGVCMSDENAIALRKNMTSDRAGEVLVHEVIHAISFLLNLKLKENQVNSLGVGLYGFLRENKINWYKRKQPV